MIDKGIPVWIFDNSLAKYIEGHIPSKINAKSIGSFDGEDLSNDEMIEVYILNSPTPIKIQKTHLQLKNPEKYEFPYDLASLTFLNEGSILHALSHRYANDKIYTYSGIFLLSINPYKHIPALYTEGIANYYQTLSLELQKEQPHIFSVASAAYNNMLEYKANQSILVTGESGSGKTENTKKIIQFFSLRNATNSIENLINLSNPILESFGNAKTIRNDNSSRFGKYIKLKFTSGGHLIGAHIDSYLLEKSRVTHHAENERSFHIFYQLIHGASPKLKETLFLSDKIEDYSILLPYYSNDSNIAIDIDNFNQLIVSFTKLGIREEEYTLYFRSIAAILHLGNIQIIKTPEDKFSLNSDVLETVAFLLGLTSVDILINSILKPNITAGRDVVVKGLSPDQISDSLGTFMRSLYEKTFGSIVTRLNSIFFQNEQGILFIGILDMAGFEIFETNSFEQLCINYTNEKLQQFFNQHMFHYEQEEYKSEGIEWNYVNYGQDLQPTIDLLEKNSPAGIFALLDEECVLPMTSDLSFTEKVNSTWKGKSGKFEPHRFSSKKGFFLTHYAGKVQYSTEGWLSKNKDPINETLSSLMTCSTIKYFSSLFLEFTQKSSTPTSSGCFFKTLLQKYKEQLSLLLATLHSSSPHFVRCLVPNKRKIPQALDQLYMLDQLRCNGVLEGIRICRNGYPNRIPFSDFRRSYFIISKSCISNMTHVDDKTSSQLILEEYQSKLPAGSFQIGKSKILFKAGVLALLESYRDDIICKEVSVFQAHSLRLVTLYKVKAKSASEKAIQKISSFIREVNDFYNWPWWKVISAIRPILEKRKVEGQKMSNEELAALQVEKASLSLRLQEQDSKLAEQDAENSTLRTELFLKSNIVNDLSNRLDAILVERDTLIASQSLKDHELTQLMSTLEDLQFKMNEQVGVVESCNGIIDAMKKENQALLDDVEKNAQQVASLELTVANFERDKKGLQRCLTELEREVENLKAKNVELESSKLQQVFEIENLNSELESANSRHETYRNDILSQLEDFKQKYSSQVNNLRMENSQLTTRLQESEALLREQANIHALKKENELDAKDKEYKLLLQRYNSLLENYNLSQTKNEELKNRLFNLDSLLLKKDAEYLQGISSLECKNDHLALELTQEQSRCNDLENSIITTKREIDIFNSKLLSLEAENASLSDLNSKLALERDKLTASLSSLHTDQSLTEKKLTIEMAYRENLLNELKSATLKNSNLESQLLSQQSRLDEAEAENKELFRLKQEIQESSDKKAFKMESTIGSLEEKVRKLEYENNTMIQDRLVYECKIATLELNLNDQASRLSIANEICSNLKTENSVSSALINSLEKEKNLLIENNLKIQQEFNEEKITLQQSVDKLIGEISAISKLYDGMQIQLGDSQKVIADLREDLAGATDRENELFQQLERVKFRLDEATKEKQLASETFTKLQALETELDSAREKMYALETKNLHLEAEKRTLTDDISLSQAQFSQLQTKHDTLEQRYKDLENHFESTNHKYKEKEMASIVTATEKLLCLTQEHLKEIERLKDECNERVSQIRADSCAKLSEELTLKNELEKSLKNLSVEIQVLTEENLNLKTQICQLAQQKNAYQEVEVKLIQEHEKSSTLQLELLKMLQEVENQKKASQKLECENALLINSKADSDRIISEYTQKLTELQTQLNLSSLQNSKLAAIFAEATKENDMLKNELLSSRQNADSQITEANENISTYLNLLAELEEKSHQSAAEIDQLQDDLAREKLEKSLLLSDWEHLKSSLQSQEIASKELEFNLSSLQQEHQSLQEKFCLQSQNIDQLKSLLMSRSVQIEDMSLALNRNKNLIKELEDTNKFLSQSLVDSTEQLENITSEKSSLSLDLEELGQKFATLKKEYDSLSSDFELEKTLKHDRITVVNTLRNRNQTLENMLSVEKARNKELESQKAKYEFAVKDLKMKLEADNPCHSDEGSETGNDDEIYSVLFSANSVASSPVSLSPVSRVSSVVSLCSPNGRRSSVTSRIGSSSQYHLAESKSPVYMAMKKQLEDFKTTISNLSKEKNTLLITCQELQRKIALLQIDKDCPTNESIHDLLLKSSPPPPQLSSSSSSSSCAELFKNTARIDSQPKQPYTGL